MLETREDRKKELQVLVVTMNQRDMTLAEKMNLSCDAVIANQADREEISVQRDDNRTIKMITTETKGVGLNRNIALLAAEAEILLFADDDMTYYDGALEKVIQAFYENREADMIIFSLDYTKSGKIIRKKYLKNGRLHLWNSMRYGACAVAVKRDVLLQNNITFHQCFGGGCIYGSGEDSLFLKECFQHKLKVYGSEIILGNCQKDRSSWFAGYNHKYYYDKGALLGVLFPHTCYFLILYFAMKQGEETDIPLSQRVKLIYEGIKGGTKLKPFSDNNEKNNFCK